MSVTEESVSLDMSNSSQSELEAATKPTRTKTKPTSTTTSAGTKIQPKKRGRPAARTKKDEKNMVEKEGVAVVEKVIVAVAKDDESPSPPPRPAKKRQTKTAAAAAAAKPTAKEKKAVEVVVEENVAKKKKKEVKKEANKKNVEEVQTVAKRGTRKQREQQQKQKEEEEEDSDGETKSLSAHSRSPSPVVHRATRQKKTIRFAAEQKLTKTTNANIMLKEVSSSRCFNGFQKVLEHFSETLRCQMKFGIYLPDDHAKGKLPVLFWLSGLTCSEENFIIKSGMQRFASKHRIVVVNPDTSPRGADVPTGLGDDPNFGVAAGFYLDATEPKFAANYKMYSYIVKEFVPMILAEYSFIDRSRCGIIGHSMGGHGALTIGLKHPEMFASLSVFAPICNPMKKSPNFGYKHLEAFLGAQKTNAEQWAVYDAVSVASNYKGQKREILIDQGSLDPFLASGDLSPDKLLAVSNPKISWNYRLRENYDHGFYFVQTFLEEHFAFHADALTATK